MRAVALAENQAFAFFPYFGPQKLQIAGQWNAQFRLAFRHSPVQRGGLVGMGNGNAEQPSFGHGFVFPGNCSYQ